MSNIQLLNDSFSRSPATTLEESSSFFSRLSMGWMEWLRKTSKHIAPNDRDPQNGYYKPCIDGQCHLPYPPTLLHAYRILPICLSASDEKDLAFKPTVFKKLNFWVFDAFFSSSCAFFRAASSFVSLKSGIASQRCHKEHGRWRVWTWCSGACCGCTDALTLTCILHRWICTPFICHGPMIAT